MRARALSFWLALSHTFDRCSSNSFSDSEFFMIAPSMFALEDVDVLKEQMTFITICFH